MRRTTTKRGPGRPTKPPRPGERNPLGLRVTAEVKERLERAARESGRSISQEVEMRLERSFAADEHLYERFGGRDVYFLASLIGRVALAVKPAPEARWIDDADGAAVIRAAADMILGALAPVTPPRSRPDEIEDRARLHAASVLASGAVADARSPPGGRRTLLDPPTPFAGVLWAGESGQPPPTVRRTRRRSRLHADGP